MTVTVVIPTFNRLNKLLETLDALSGQTFREFTVIVVDDGSTDGTTEKLKTRHSAYPFPLQILFQINAGASAATNSGVRLAGDGLVILFDDDILPSAECLALHVRFHESNVGAILSGSADTDPARTTTDIQRYKLYMEQKWKEARPDTHSLLEVGFENFIITTANMSLQRDLFLSLDGFSVDLRDGYDVDFGFRALMKNAKLYFDRNVKTIHNDQISLRYYAGRQRAYTTSKREIVKKHPELKSRLSDEQPTVSGFKAFAYRLLRKSFAVNIIESAAFRVLIPRALRYRIYGSTIASLSYLP